MREWSTRALSDLISLQRGYDLPTERRTAGTVPVVGSGGISGWHNEAREEGPGVVVGRAGASIGKPTLVKGPYWPLNTTLFVKDFKGNNPRWVYYLFEITDFTGFNSGGAQPMLNRNYISGLKIRTPGISQQRAIADLLGVLDDKIAANEALVGAIDKYLACKFDQLCAGAALGTLRDIAAVSTSVARPVIGGDLRYLDISAVSVGTYSLPSLTKWEEAPGRARRVLKAGDTVWSTVRPNRRSHALLLDDDPRLVGSTGLAVLSPRKGRIACTYESSRREDFVQYLEGVAEGSAYPAVRVDRFNEAPVPALRDDQWDRFESIALPLRKRSHAALVENRWLAATRDQLLPLLMSGKLRVRDAEKIVGGLCDGGAAGVQ